MRMKRFFWLVAAGSLLASTLFSGPVVIDGTDANDHGSSSGTANIQGWAYMQKVLENEAGAVGGGVAKVVADLGTTAGLQARLAIDSAFALSTLPGLGWTITHVDQANIDTFLSSLSVGNTGILYIPTVDNSAGDLPGSLLTNIATHALQINDFVNNGGGLFAMSESPTTGTAYSWLIALLPTVSTVDIGAGGSLNPITLTTNGMAAFPGLTSADLSAGPWHNYFLGTFGGLSVLGTAVDGAGVQRAVIIGGGAGTSIVPPLLAVICTGATASATHAGCITRDARFWFSHPETNDATCATLRRAIAATAEEVCLGFQTLPVEYENNDNAKDGEDALIEALGLYWRSQKRTGEEGGRQSLRLPGSSLCRARKQLAVEMIAAVANNSFLGTGPANCSYFDGVSTVPFPTNLIEQASRTATAEDVAAIRAMTVLLRKFNSSGLTNDFPAGMTECSAWPRSRLRAMARDPLTQFTCPGLNDGPFTAEALTSFPYIKTVDLSKYGDDFANTSCGTGGADAVWKVTPTVGRTGRSFVVDTFGSTIDTLLSVWQSTGVGAALLDCNDDANATPQSQLIFKSDGINTFFIVVEGKLGATGKVKIRVRSF